MLICAFLDAPAKCCLRMVGLHTHLIARCDCGWFRQGDYLVITFHEPCGRERQKAFAPQSAFSALSSQNPIPSRALKPPQRCSSFLILSANQEYEFRDAKHMTHNLPCFAKLRTIGQCTT